jgi:replication initiation and membrane attachment protein
LEDPKNKRLTPLTGFWCLPTGFLNDEDRRILTDLYLPLIGPKAFAIYQLLWAKVPDKEIITNRESHSVLLSLIDIDTNQFQAERLKLEALNLIKTYAKTDNMGDVLIYQLFEPLTPDEFFKDDIFSIFLLEKIGETQYQILAEKYQKSTKVLDGSTDISKGFLEVFKLSDEDLKNKPKLVLDTKAEFTGNLKPESPHIDASQVQKLDLGLVEERINDLYKISKDDFLKNRDLIVTLHEFYGIDTMPMIDLIGASTNLVDNTIDTDSFKREAQRRFENRSNINVRVAQEPVDTTPQPTSNNPESILLHRAKTSAPADFLADEKNQLGGFTGNSEARALRTLASRGILPNQVLNIMVHYILQNSPTLTLPFMETIANDWKQNGVKTAEDAIKRLNDFQNRPKNPKRRRYSNNSNKVEHATDWSKVQSKPVAKSNDKDAEAARLEMLRKLRNKDN